MSTEDDINRAINNIVRRMYERAKDRMVERGYEETDVTLVGNVIKFDTKKTPRVAVDPTAYRGFLEMNLADFMSDRTTDEYIDDWIDYYVDAPAYKYDEDFPAEGEYDPTTAMGTQPGTKVNIDDLKEWVRTVKIGQDPILQDLVVTGNVKKFEAEVDRVAYKVARKIYYVGKKPAYMTPEDWDATTVHARPQMNTYSSKESASAGSFKYGSNYTYRQGVM